MKNWKPLLGFVVVFLLCSPTAFAAEAEEVLPDDIWQLCTERGQSYLSCKEHFFGFEAVSESGCCQSSDSLSCMSESIATWFENREAADLLAENGNKLGRRSSCLFQPDAKNDELALTEDCSCYNGIMGCIPCESDSPTAALVEDRWSTLIMSGSSRGFTPLTPIANSPPQVRVVYVQQQQPRHKSRLLEYALIGTFSSFGRH